MLVTTTVVVPFGVTVKTNGMMKGVANGQPGKIVVFTGASAWARTDTDEPLTSAVGFVGPAWSPELHDARSYAAAMANGSALSRIMGNLRSRQSKLPASAGYNPRDYDSEEDSL